MALSLSCTAITFAEHDEKDPYDAMCQLSSAYSASMQNHANKRTTYAIQLYGHCGEQPNIIVIDEPQKQNKTDSHMVTVWRSPKKDATYWMQIYKRYYDLDKQGKLIKSRRDEPDTTNFIKAEIQQPFTLVIKRYCSAKKGSPIFPHAEGDLTCNRGVKNDFLLEIGYMDYCKDVIGEKP